jgi:hypothetical protein
MSLTNLPLSEAVLLDVRFDWQAARCTCTFQPDDMELHVLIFNGVSELHVPCVRPWGPSAQVDGITERGAGLFEIELLSGDVIRIAAANWEFRKERRAEPRG